MEKNVSDERINKTLTSILRKDSNVSKETPITYKTNLRDDLGFDDLDIYEFVYAVERELKVNVADEVANMLETVGEMYFYLKGYQQASLA